MKKGQISLSLLIIFLIVVGGVFLIGKNTGLLAIAGLDGSLTAEPGDCDVYDEVFDICTISSFQEFNASIDFPFFKTVVTEGGTILSSGNDLSFVNLELKGVVSASGSDGADHMGPSGIDVPPRPLPEDSGDITISKNLIGNGFLKVNGGQGGNGYARQAQVQPGASAGSAGGDGGDIVIKGLASEYIGEFEVDFGIGGSGRSGFDCGRPSATSCQWCGCKKPDGTKGDVQVFNIDFMVNMFPELEPVVEEVVVEEVVVETVVEEVVVQQPVVEVTPQVQEIVVEEVQEIVEEMPEEEKVGFFQKIINFFKNLSFGA
jgi:hypothetical protein